MRLIKRRDINLSFILYQLFLISGEKKIEFLIKSL